MITRFLWNIHIESAALKDRLCDNNSGNIPPACNPHLIIWNTYNSNIGACPTWSDHLVIMVGYGIRQDGCVKVSNTCCHISNLTVAN